jgi:hypothetical protein
LEARNEPSGLRGVIFTAIDADHRNNREPFPREQCKISTRSKQTSLAPSGTRLGEEMYVQTSFEEVSLNPRGAKAPSVRGACGRIVNLILR